MITELSPLFARVATYTKPEDILLKRGAWVRFSDAWPDTHKWAKGKAFIVTEEPLLVPYPVAYILPGDDFKEIDLSNTTAGLKLYPVDEGVLYQIAVGLGKGEYIIHTYIPKDKYIYTLGASSMYPPVSPSSTESMLYLGAKSYEDSPIDSPLWYLYAIKDMAAFHLKLYVEEGVDFEKVILKFMVNKTQLAEIPLTDEVKEKALLIRFESELVGF